MVEILDTCSMATGSRMVVITISRMPVRAIAGLDQASRMSTIENRAREALSGLNEPYGAHVAAEQARSTKHQR